MKYYILLAKSPHDNAFNENKLEIIDTYKMFDILALPAMIRNTIYFYVFEPENEDTFIRPASIREGQGVAGYGDLKLIALTSN